MFDNNDDCKLDFDIEEIVRETDKAWCVLYEGEEIWVPKSISELNDDKNIISIPEWFAKKNGFEV